MNRLAAVLADLGRATVVVNSLDDVDLPLLERVAATRRNSR